ncbi:conserved hypothetical protein [Vibrio chagasii]|nr:conserved hypothetical protein [Vibrio chagasii]
MTALVWFAAMFVVSLVIMIFLASCYKKVKGQGWMLVVNGRNKIRATTNGTFIIPIVDRYEHVRVTDRTITIRREGKKDGWKSDGDTSRGLSCNCGIRVNIIATFYIKFPQLEEKTITSITNRLTTMVINDDNALTNYFAPILNETLKNVVAKHEYENLIEDRESFANAVSEELNGQLQGLVLERVAIDEVQHSTLDSHDPENTYDSKGIEKILRITSDKALKAKEIKEETETASKKFEVEGQNSRLSLSRDEHKRSEEIKREKAIITAEENRVAQEQALDNERAIKQKQIEVAQDVEQREQNKNAAVQQAEVDVERKVRLSQVEAAQAGDLAQEEANKILVSKRSETAIQEEQARLEQSEVKARRVEVDRQTAVQEEETADLRTERSVSRNQVEVVGEAEAGATATATSLKIESETKLILESQDAERRTIAANADLEVADKTSAAIERKAQAKIAEESAEGLAQAKVHEATGLANASVTEAEGKAEALTAEALGIAKAKAEKELREAMSVDGETRQHEINLAQIENNKEVRLFEIEQNAQVGVAQAKALGDAYSGANVTLYGNNSDFADTIVGAKADKAIAFENPVIGKTLEGYENGEGKLISDLEMLVKNTPAGDLMNLALAKKLADGSSANPADIIASLATNITGEAKANNSK